jgi:transcriptional regulator GlxA family with amidase domain
MKHISIVLPYGFSSAASMALYETFKVSELVKNPGGLSVSFMAPEKMMTSYLGTQHIIASEALKKTDVLIVTGSAGTSKEEVFKNLERSEEWVLSLIKKAKSNGATICSSCSGAYFLARAGLLKNKKATTAWWLSPEMKKLFPDTNWSLDEILVPQGKVITAGGSMSALELSSAILAKFTSQETIAQTEKFLVLPAKRKNQRSYKIRSLLDNPIIAGALKYIHANIETCDVNDLKRQMKMETRTLYRFCQKNLNQSPYQWIREIRLDRAQKLLEQTDLTVDEIAFKVGYSDTTSFFRSFKKSYGLSPSQYRSK